VVEVRAASTLIAERYRVESSLGVGGMGAVYRVRDERAGRAVALKELHITEGSVNALIASQFEREYHTLVQLSHPSIIEVYDYGVDQRGYPYYTMELLDGQDLRERSPPTWQEACALLRDVASSLAIMHSRRLLHRDISARNIRCTTNGRAKLIDFGAMAPMGVLKNVVGTPPFVPPEALQMQALDGRSDLYALGGVLYWLMTRRHAYPARNFNELPDLWRTPIASPRQYDADLPPALDQLIMQLLQLDRNARPVSAAEVIERLTGIANLPVDENPAVSAAYLATPMLVGREALLKQARTQLVKARHGQGQTILIEGAAGLGRSRALDACVLDAKLLGAIVLRSGPADAEGDYGVARSLAEQLFSAVPRLARRSAALRKDVLAHVLPRLRDPETVGAAPVSSLSPIALASLAHVTATPTAIPSIFDTHPPIVSEPVDGGTQSAANRPERRQLQAALRDFIMSAARDKHLVLVIDDVEAIDEPSAALLVMLANSAKRRKLTLLVSAPVAEAVQGSSASALGLLRQIGERIALTPLDPPESEMLLRSVFGDVPNLAAVSEGVHRVAEGNPRWTMELIQHLVTRGLARYEAGSWTLPAALSAGDVPTSLSDSLLLRLSELSDDARALADALAVTDAALLSVSNYSNLTDHGDRARSYKAVSDLVASGVLVAAGEGYRFRYRELASVLRDRLPPERARELHQRIARELQHADHAGQRAEHLLLGGMDQEGIQLVLALATNDQAPLPPMTMSALIERALRSAERMSAPARVCVVLRCRLLFLSALLGDYERFVPLLPVVRRALMSQSGLADYAELEQIAEPEVRFREAVRRARERREALPEAERAFIPEEAAAWLSFLCGACAYMAAIAQEIRFVDDVPVTAPILPLSWMLLNIDRSVDSQRALQQGRDAVSRAHCEGLLLEFDGPAYTSLTPALRAIRRGPFLYMLGLFDAVLGKPTALEYVKQLDLPNQRGNAWRVRMVYELMHGRTEAAATCQRRAELLVLQDSNSATLPGTTVRTELLAAIYSDDVLAVKRCMERSEALAQRYPHWKPTLALARAHYRRLQGDPEAGLVFANEALALVSAGRHINWALAVTTQLTLLNALHRSHEAVALGESYLDVATREALDAARTPLLRVMAESYLHAGRPQDARRLADEHLALHLAQGTGGLQLGLAYETLTRVAIAMHDEAAVLRYAQLCAEEYKGSRNALLSRKYQQLMREADEAGVAVGTTQRHAADFTAAMSAADDSAQTLHSRLLSAVGGAERSEQALRLLLETHGAVAGYLFRTHEGQLELLAASNEDEPSLELVRTLEGCLVTLTQAVQTTQDVADEEATLMQPLGEAAEVAESTAFENAEDSSALSARLGAQLDVNVDGFEPLPLFAKSDGERVLVALAALRFERGSRRVVPSSTLAAFAEALRKLEPA
jgi:hypothetical protein